MIKIDLHTHSQGSGDGGISIRGYEQLIDSGKLNLIAITDHNDISYAQKVAKHPEIGDRVIVGQEVMTDEGEMIGLFLKKKIEDGMSPQASAVAIKKQSGLILIPHPEDKHRSGLSIESIEQILEYVDIIEVKNGRELSKPKQDITHWAKQNNLLTVANSDAHSKSGAGRTFTLITDGIDSPTIGVNDDLLELLNHKKRLVYEQPPLLAFLAPSLNRLKKRFKH